ncbi:MAG: class I SAM-dependent rRNA methyltransferase [Bacteroidales bacterium]|jgi:23S rRNA (cytosine1962-C5)-methyltransferase|nr:class I SAM-dependent rRNA methyltransferase [Bacteroidales bacterium]
MERIKLVLKSGKEKSVKRFHPWIFSGAIKGMSGNPANGDMVDVFDNHGDFLASGHYNRGTIAVRILSFNETEADDDFFSRQISNAIACRRAAGISVSPDLNVFRLVHGEGDGLPGLVIDYYNGVAVMQCHSMGFYNIRHRIANVVAGLPGINIKAVYDKSSSALHSAAADMKDEYLVGHSEPATVTENGFRFSIDWVGGQKTGFFIDQRNNRRLLGELSAGKKVLNMFGYTGGFSVYAMKNAELVHTVDSSAAATALADENIRLNYGNDKRHQSFRHDAFDYLNSINDKYDLIILDPPAFAKHSSALDNALQGYKKLNMKALKSIRAGGMLFTFSCSQAVSREEFRKSVFAAAANTGRNVRIMYQLTQPPDHPVSIYHPEGEYLKGLAVLVD